MAKTASESWRLTEVSAPMVTVTWSLKITEPFVRTSVAPLTVSTSPVRLVTFPATTSLSPVANLLGLFVAKILNKCRFPLENVESFRYNIHNWGRPEYRAAEIRTHRAGAQVNNLLKFVLNICYLEF